MAMGRNHSHVKLQVVKFPKIAPTVYVVVDHQGDRHKLRICPTNRALVDAMIRQGGIWENRYQFPDEVLWDRYEYGGGGDAA